jgi:hypothetical protein
LLRHLAARLRALASASARTIRTRPYLRPWRVLAATLLVLVAAMLALASGDKEVTETATAEAEPTASPSESREAYSDQSDGEALATDRDGFDGLLDGPPLKWPPAHAGEQIHGYLSDHAAIVTEAGGERGLIESTLPLRGETPGGDSAPIDLGLVDAGDTSFAPRSSAAAVRIPDESTGELRFPDQSFGLRLADAEPQDANIESNKAFFANVFEDGDLVIEPRPAGAEVSIVLRSAAAPTSPELSFDLAGGQTLRRVVAGDQDVPAGSVELVEGGRRVAAVYPAVAVDAAGESVPVTYELDGERLALHVETSGETTYPVLVDPPVGIYDNYGTSAGSSNPDGFKWKGWAPATSADTLTWSFCNNQASFPGRKLYFCQGSLSGSMAEGGGLFIKANAGQGYADETWGQWAKEAPPGAYIYKLDATGLTNFAPAQAQLAVGVRTPSGSGWEWGSVRAANGATDSGDADAPTGYSYPAAYRTPAGVALSNATRYLFVHKGDGLADPAPSSAIAPQNRALVRMIMSSVTAGSPPPYVAMGGAATYESETTPPTIGTVNHSNSPSNAWVDSYTDTVATTATDVGLGMGTIKLTNGSSAIATYNACTLNGAPVPGSSAQTKNHYDSCPLALSLPSTMYAAPEGPSTYAITATDLVQNAPKTTQWSVKVDKTPPSSLNFTGGTLTGQDGQLIHGPVTLNYSASDAYSGVKAVKLYVEDMASAVATDPQPATCGTAGCPTTVPGKLTFDADEKNADGSYRYAEGSHDVKVVAEDPLAAGPGSHKTERSFTVVIDRTAPSTGVSGPLSNAEEGTRLTADDPTVTVEALDEPEPIDGTESGVRTAGVKTVEIKLDGVSVQRLEQPCAGGGCSMNRDFQVSTSQLGNGTHTATVITTDFAGNVGEQTWDFVIDRVSAKPSCSDPDADPDDCQPEPVSTAQPDCLPQVVDRETAGGTAVTPADAVSTTRATMPDAVGESEPAVAENHDLEPAVDDGSAGFESQATLETSNLGASVASYTVGAGFDATCIAPSSTTTEQSSPTPVTNGTGDTHPDAVAYDDTAASTDTILRANPKGVEEVTQIRDEAAPESQSYEITPEPGKYLKQLDSGVVAVIDSSLPTTSGALPPYDLGTQTPLLDPADPGEDRPDDEYDPADDTYTDEELAELTPDSSDVSPTDTANQYESDSRLLQVANEESDGQAVAVITPPSASDDSGTAVPTSLSLVPGTNRVTLTTDHQGASLDYPVTVAHKALVTSAKHKVDYGLSVTLASDLFARKLNTGSPAQGAPRIRAGLNARWARYNMYYFNSCDYFIPADGDFAGDMPPDPDGLPAGTEYERLYRESARRCLRAIDFIDKAFDAGLTPYITLIADQSLPKYDPNNPDPPRHRVTPKEYAQSAVNLWKTAPFNRVKYWGPTNEPDVFAWLAGRPGAYAADIYVAMVDAAHDPERGAFCKKCKISAGGFARSRGDYRPDVLHYTGDATHEEYKTHTDYVKAYMNRLTHLNRHPKRWEFHDYPDTGNEKKVFKDPIHNYKPKKVSYPQLQTFIKLLNDRPKLDPKHAKIWIMEAGVKLFAGEKLNTPDKNEGVPTELDGRGRLQIEAAMRFKYFSSFKKVAVVSYYQVFGRDVWDTAVLTPPDRPGSNQDVDPPGPAYDPTVIPENREFRKVYCVLTKQTTQQTLDTLCPAIRHRPDS